MPDVPPEFPVLRDAPFKEPEILCLLFMASHVVECWWDWE